MDFSFEESTNKDNHEIDEAFVPRLSSQSHFSNQRKLDDLIKDLGLTKSGVEI